MADFSKSLAFWATSVVLTNMAQWAWWKTDSPPESSSAATGEAAETFWSWLVGFRRLPFWLILFSWPLICTAQGYQLFAAHFPKAHDPMWYLPLEANSRTPLGWLVLVWMPVLGICCQLLALVLLAKPPQARQEDQDVGDPERGKDVVAK